MGGSRAGYMMKLGVGESIVFYAVRLDGIDHTYIIFCFNP